MLDLYRRLIAIEVRSQLQYRVSFLFDCTAAALVIGVEFATLVLVLQRFQNIAGWSLAEVAFLYGMVQMAFGVMDMLFSGFDPGDFGQLVRRGTFDQLLLRPLSVTLQILGSKFLLRRIGRIFNGIAIYAWAVASLDIQWTLGKIFYVPVVFASLVAFYGGLFMIGATVTFWTVESIEVVNIFTYGGTEIMSYPMTIYQDWMRRFFTYIVPSIFLNYYPALYFLDKPDPFNFPYFVHFLAPLAGFGVLFLALQFWHFGIRHYQSTGT
ncbi:MAG: ABC-2 family transporter protein [Chloroflexi bacterium]|nr:ABC-2 family transporter protein [Chloroflexota bacterium]